MISKQKNKNIEGIRFCRVFEILKRFQEPVETEVLTVTNVCDTVEVIEIDYVKKHC